jgi:hypothetical protein
VDGRIILKLMLEESDVMLWTGLNCGNETKCRLLWTRWWTFGFRKSNRVIINFSRNFLYHRAQIPTGSTMVLLLFTITSRPAPESTQPPIQRVMGDLFPEVKRPARVWSWPLTSI